MKNFFIFFGNTRQNVVRSANYLTALSVCVKWKIGRLAYDITTTVGGAHVQFGKLHSLRPANGEEIQQNLRSLPERVGAGYAQGERFPASSPQFNAA
jgi:hypothetical protein